ncbi:MAG: ATP-grasp domain-containing protein [Oscillospiraceae bacterium]|jgi:argininosuccinate lyase|nr:ATP-grasp domain-containing protein [Oscillospiraceae bacterium]
MAHILMVESWVGASGNILPPLLKDLGHSYTFVTRKPSHYQSALSTEKHAVFRYADNVIETETNDTPGLIDAVKSVPFDGVTTVCDYYIETAREIARAYNRPCPFPAEVKSVRQKHLMRQAIDKARLPNPAYRLASTWAQVEAAGAEIGYPLVLKPVDLASSAFVRLIQNAEDLKSAYNDLEAFPLNFRDQPRDSVYLLEEYMSGEEVSVESVSCNGATTILGVTDKSVTGIPYFIENGHMFPAKLADSVRSGVTAFVLDVLKAVGFDRGVAHTEVKITNDGPRIVEINPRTAGNYIVELVERVTGINLMRAFVDLSLGIQPELKAKGTGVTSAAIMFIVPPQGGVVKSLTGADTLESDTNIVRYKIEDCVEKELEKPIDNACYLGHVVTQDKIGFNARAYVENAISRIDIAFENTEDKL